MTDPQPELIQLVQTLFELIPKKFGLEDGLLASIFIADALKAGGIDKARFQLAATELTVPKLEASKAALKLWRDKQGGAEVMTMSHNFLKLDDWSIDPVINQILPAESGIYQQGQVPACYGPISSQAIYRAG